MAKEAAKKSEDERAPGGEPAMSGISLPHVGERRNYNLQPDVTAYRHWPFSTIEWVADETRYRARAMVQHTRTRDLVAFRSWHEDFTDGERAIDLLHDSLDGVSERRVINIFGEVVEVRTVDIGGGSRVQMVEVQALIWTMQHVPGP